MCSLEDTIAWFSFVTNKCVIKKTHHGDGVWIPTLQDFTKPKAFKRLTTEFDIDCEGFALEGILTLTSMNL